MLFNSTEFLFAFLPLAYLAGMAIARIRPSLVVPWLGAASIVFYVYWSIGDTAILLASVLFNYVVGGYVLTEKRDRWRDWITVFGVAVNLSVLAYFKYAGFLLQNISALTGVEPSKMTVILPLGISFFTFTQIAFLIDCHRRKVVAHSFSNFILFVTYFPHLIAGPIIHHKEMMPQFSAIFERIGKAEYLSIGLTIFVVGLFKKVVLADNIAPFADAMFLQAAQESPGFFVAWAGAISYAMQIYFDFSGYSDMAIGISYMFGVRLPLNFNSPYKSRSIIEFWRRWHMTLSRFLRDYLYYPLGGNRRGPFRRYVNLFITMLLGGLWHGANWTFVVWGALHGIYLVINHGFRSTLKRSRYAITMEAILNSGMGRACSTAVTLMLVVVAWVYFRASDIAIANGIIEGMFGFNGVQLPSRYLPHLHGAGDVLKSLGIEFILIPGELFGSARQILLLVALFVVVFALPNMNEVMRTYAPAMNSDEGVTRPQAPATLLWRPDFVSLTVICILGGAALWVILNVNESRFIYFNF